MPALYRATPWRAGAACPPPARARGGLAAGARLSPTRSGATMTWPLGTRHPKPGALQGVTRRRGRGAGRGGVVRAVLGAGEGLEEVAATVVSFAVAGGAAFLYFPQISRLLQSPEAAEGVATETFVLKLVGYTFSTVYGFKRELPFAVYAPEVLLTAQTALVLLLIAQGKGAGGDPRGRAFAVGYLAFFGAIIAADFSPSVLTAMQLVNVGIFTSSLVPQLQLNYKSKSAGGYSPLTAGAASLGCLVRLGAASELTGDIPLLASLAIGVVLNGTLVGQILYYGTRSGRSVLDVLTADLGGTKGGTKGGDDDDGGGGSATAVRSRPLVGVRAGGGRGD